jgi:ribosomal protein S18 acetylase RimI-like enzyme
MVRVSPIAHRERFIAEGIHAVMSLAYLQEARLLKVTDFPPLTRTVEDIEASEDFFLGAILHQEIVGVLSVGRDDEPHQICISALVVHPKMQRRGVGRLLVQEALARGQGTTFSVATAAKNVPALRLYQEFGFIPYRHGVVGPNSLPLVKLKRAA